MKQVYVVTLDEEFEKSRLEKGRGPDKNQGRRLENKSIRIIKRNYMS